MSGGAQHPDSRPLPEEGETSGPGPSGETQRNDEGEERLPETNPAPDPGTRRWNRSGAVILSLLLAWLVPLPAPGAGTQAEAQQPGISPCDEGRLAPLRAEVERIRGLRFDRPLACRVDDRAALARKLRAEWEKKSPAEWDAIEARLHHFGLLPADARLRDLLLPILGEQVAAYYDFEEKVLVVVRDGGDPLADEAELGSLAGVDLDRITLLHELDHALADGAADLGASLARRKGQNDAENAFLALVEGEATWTMMATTMVDLGGKPEDLADPIVDGLVDSLEQSLSPASGSGALGGAPPAIRESLLFPYLAGFRFVRALVARGGMPLADAALLAPPETTRSILHPELWGNAPERFRRILWPATDPASGAGWRILEEETYGEQDLGLLLGRGEPSSSGLSAEGWAGDRWRLYRSPAGRTGAAGVVEFESLDQAALFEASIRSRLARLRGAGPKDPSVSTRVVRSGVRVVVVDHLPTRLVDEVAERLKRADLLEELCPPPAR